MGGFDSGPYCSARKRFSARIEIGLSISPRRHAVSQGCAHTRPHMLAKGLGSRASRYASSNLPSAIRPTYRPALVCAGHAIMHGKFVCSQSASTFLFLNRFSIAAAQVRPESERQPISRKKRRGEGRMFPSSVPHLLTVKSAFAPPDTLTGLD